MGAGLLEAKRLIASGAEIAFAPQPGPQSALLSCPIGDVLFGGARGGGKTYALLGDWLAHALNYGRGAKGLFIRRTYDELDEVKAQAAEIFPLVGAYWRAGKSTWIFPNGATLKLRYLRRDEDASHYQGHQYTWIGIDEIGNFPDYTPIDKLQATLRSKTGVPTFMRSSANPGGPGHAWIKARYVDPAQPMVPHQDPTTGLWRVFIPSRLEDNRILVSNDPHYQQRLRGSGPAWLVRAWLSGDWNASPEGGIVKAEWFQRYREVPVDAELIVQSWDTAYKPDQINDPSACTTWSVGRRQYFLRDVFCERMDYPSLKRAVINSAEKWKPHAVLIEDKASGQSLIQELRNSTRLPVIAIDPSGQGDKVTRMNAASIMFEAGKVALPHAAPWLLDYEIELTIFPLAPHDDRVDSTSQFLNWVKDAAISVEAWASGRVRIGIGAYDDRGLPPSESQIDADRGYGTLRGGSDFNGF